MKDFWFKHDAGAGRDIKLRKIQHIYGHEGKGLFWDVIEILREEDKNVYPSDENSLQMLCDIIGYKDVKRFLNWYNDCKRVELFHEKNGYFFSQSLIERMKYWKSKVLNGKKLKGVTRAKRNRSEIEADRQEYRIEYNIKNIIEENIRDEYEKTAFHFWKIFKKNIEDQGIKPTVFEKANIVDWAIPIRLMIENKECSMDDLRDIYNWLKKHNTKNSEFWSKNIRSTQKLREKLTDLLIQVKEDTKVNGYYKEVMSW
jgi:hypothetical protein